MSKITVWKEKKVREGQVMKRPGRPHTEGMWVGKCDQPQCAEWQFWFFGATLGYGLEHQRRCGR